MAVIKLQRVHPNAVLPTRLTPKSFGYDLSTVEPVVIAPRSCEILKTGWKLVEDLPLVETTTLIPVTTLGGTAYEKELVGGVAMQILPRSSTLLKWNLLVGNSPGLIDADYTGEIGIVVYNLHDKNHVLVPAGTRIAQAVFGYLDFFKVVEVTEADVREARGGFGSTGT